jgi:hypothetical protein
MTISSNSTLNLDITFTPSALSLQGSLAIISTDNQNSIDLAVELLGIGLDGETPLVRNLVPNGGETFTSKQQVKITWLAQDNSSIARQELRLSTDGGNTFPIIIASGLFGAREFIWTVPEINTSTAKIKILSTDLSGNTGERISLRNFTIKTK